MATELQVGQRWTNGPFNYVITDVRANSCPDHDGEHVHMKEGPLGRVCWNPSKHLINGECGWSRLDIECPAATPSAAIPAYLRKPTGNYSVTDAIKKLAVSMNDLATQQTAKDLKWPMLDAFRLTERAYVPMNWRAIHATLATPRDHAKRTDGDLAGFTARAATPDAVAGCRLGCACKVHRPAKPEPYAPAIDEWDLLPDA